ncbi:MAG: hypothetical protein ABID38_02520 [Candidatus Diapherotrites archaeon]
MMSKDKNSDILDSKDLDIIDSKEYRRTRPEKNAITEEGLEKLLSQGSKMDLALDTHMNDLPDNYVVLVVVKPSNYQGARRALFRRLISREGLRGIYITINKRYDNIKAELKQEKLDADNLHFIDMISNIGEENAGKPGVDFINSATELTELMLVAEKRLDEIERGKGFLIFDSISTLLVYNKSDPVEKMAHNLISLINGAEAKGVLLMMDTEEYKGTMQTISQFCDKMFRLD